MIPLRRFPAFEEFKELELRLNEMVNAAVASQLRGGPGIRIKQTGANTVVSAVQQEVRASRSQFRGEYNQAFGYAAGDEFLVSVGPEAANYRTIKDCPPNPTGLAIYFPWAGTGYFVLIGRLSDQSSWL